MLIFFIKTPLIYYFYRKFRRFYISVIFVSFCYKLAGTNARYGFFSALSPNIL